MSWRHLCPACWRTQGGTHQPDAIFESTPSTKKGEGSRLRVKGIKRRIHVFAVDVRLPAGDYAIPPNSHSCVFYLRSRPPKPMRLSAQNSCASKAEACVALQRPLTQTTGHRVGLSMNEMCKPCRGWRTDIESVSFIARKKPRWTEQSLVSR